MRRAAAAGLAAALLLAGGAAQARQLWADDEQGASLELGGFYKTFAAGLVLPEWQGSSDLLLAQRPEYRGALATQVARLQARFLFAETLDFEAAWQVGGLVASREEFVSGFALGGASGTGESGSRRLVDFDGVFAESRTMRLVHDLDRLALKLSLPGADVVLGRQVLGWGSGRIWNPTDLLSPFAPTALDKEVRRGVDALRVSVPLGSTGLFDALWLPQRGADQGFVLRAQANFLGYDFSLSTAKYVSDLVLGADFSGDAGPLGVHGEAAWTMNLSGWSGDGLGVEEEFLRAVGGVEWRPLDSLVLLAEYHFNGHGAAEPDDYAARALSERVASGEVFGVGRHYLGLVSSWAASDLLTLQATVLLNLLDPSAMLMPVLEWSAAQNALVRLGAFVPVGANPSGHLDGTVRMHSEYGSSPAGLMVQTAIHY